MAREWDDMLASLPTAYRKDAWVIALLSAIAGMDSAQRTDADETAQQMFLDSMTWALAIEERIAGITPAAVASVEERRSVLQAKWRSATGKCDIDLIQRVCDSWKNGEVDVQYSGGTITLQFVGSLGVPADMATLQDAIAAIVPAHIPLQYIIKFKLWRDFADTTWGSMAEQTWDQLQEVTGN